MMLVICTTVLAANSGTVKCCEDVLSQKSGKQVYDKLQVSIREFASTPKETTAATVFFSFLILDGANGKGLTSYNLSKFAIIADRIAEKTFVDAETTLLQGWWLSSCAPRLRMRTDKPSRIERKQIEVNGKVQWFEGAVYDSVDPAIDRGRRLVAAMQLKMPMSPLTLLYRMRSADGLPVSGNRSIRKAYSSFDPPFSLFFLKELIRRDSASPDSSALRAEWTRIASAKQPPFVLQYLLAADPQVAK